MTAIGIFQSVSSHTKEKTLEGSLSKKDGRKDARIWKGVDNHARQSDDDPRCLL